MTDDELGARLRDAFDARARTAVPESAAPPTPRFVRNQPQRGRWLAPLAAAAVVLAVAVAAAVVLHHPKRSAPAASAKIRVAWAADTSSYGVGMPVVAYFSHRFANGEALAAATAVTVNEKPVRAAWYFMRSSGTGYPIEGHLRMRSFWPAHSEVHVAIAANEITTSTTVDFHTGARTIAVVEDARHRMIVTRDGKLLGAFPVSLGTARTPTARGTKVIMAKKPSICLSGPGFHQCGIKYAQQLTDDGEYLIAAPWNPGIKGGFDSSNGCTNLLPDDARLLYKVLEVGDVVEYPDATGPRMTTGAGYGDWNVPWRVWLKGGLIPTS